MFCNQKVWGFLRLGRSKFAFVVAFFLRSFTRCSSSATKTITSSGAIKHTTRTHTHIAARRHRDSERVTQVNPESEQPHSIAVTILSKILPKHTHARTRCTIQECGCGRAKFEKCKHPTIGSGYFPISTCAHKQTNTHTRTLARWRELLRRRRCIIE